MDAIDRAIINTLQGGFPICDHPYREAAQNLGIEEDELIGRLEQMLEKKQLSRFGPLYNAEQLGGGLSLCAMEVPEGEFEQVAEQVNSFPEVAHNYARDHQLNMWFVLATETPDGIEQTLGKIEETTGLQVFNMPKQQEFFIGLRFEV